MSENTQSKRSKCIYCHLTGPNWNEFSCTVDGWEDENIKKVSREDCEKCDKYRSRFIEYPITVNSIENNEIKSYALGHTCGTLCEIKPCGEEYEGKSYLGIYIGELPIRISSSYDESTGTLKNSAITNPAIFVPELKKIIYGCESWWREIESIEDFKGISDEDIENIWYVKMLKEMSDNE